MLPFVFVYQRLFQASTKLNVSFLPRIQQTWRGLNAYIVIICFFSPIGLVHMLIVVVHELGGFLLDSLGDQDVGVEEPLDAVLQTGLRPGVQPGAGFGGHASVPALVRQLHRHRLQK